MKFSNEQILNLTDARTQNLIFKAYFKQLKFKYNEEVAIAAINIAITTFKTPELIIADTLGGLFTKYVNMIAYNESTSVYRQSQLKKNQPFAARINSGDIFNYIPNEEKNEEDELERKILIMLDKINELPVKYQEILELRLKGYKNREIAVKLNRTEGNVKALIARSIVLLKEVMVEKKDLKVKGIFKLNNGTYTARKVVNKKINYLGVYKTRLEASEAIIRFTKNQK